MYGQLLLLEVVDWQNVTSQLSFERGNPICVSKSRFCIQKWGDNLTGGLYFGVVGKSIPNIPIILPIDG